MFRITKYIPLLLTTVLSLAPMRAHAAAPTLTGVQLTYMSDNYGETHIDGGAAVTYAGWPSVDVYTLDPVAWGCSPHFFTFLNENFSPGALGVSFSFKFSFSDGSSYCWSSTDALALGTMKMTYGQSLAAPSGWELPAYNDSAWTSPIYGAVGNYYPDPCGGTSPIALTPYNGSLTCQAACKEKVYYRVWVPAVTTCGTPSPTPNWTATRSPTVSPTPTPYNTPNPACVVSSSSIITTVAGNGGGGFSGDGGAATSANLNLNYFPGDNIAVDAVGNFYIADFWNSRIRKVTVATGIITTVAGTGSSGFAGDGGAATSGQINQPGGIAVDGAGNLYIADTNNNRIRMVNVATGVITTIAGTGGAGFSGDGGAATAAQLNQPMALAVDASGNIYEADRNNCRIRMIAAGTGIISTVAGSASCGFLGDGGAATSARLNFPSGISLDPAGNLYIADTNNCRVRKVAVGTGIITTLAGSATCGNAGNGGAATAAQLNSPTDVKVDGAGNLIIADTNNNRVQIVDMATGIVTTLAGTGTNSFGGDGGPASAAKFSQPEGLAIDPNGNLLILDKGNERIRKIAASCVTTPTNTPSFSPTDTATRSFTPTPSATPSRTPTPTSTETVTSTRSSTATPSPTRSATLTATLTISATPTDTSSVTATQTRTVTLSSTPSATPTQTRTVTPSPTFSITGSPSFTSTRTATASTTPSFTATPSFSNTVTISYSPTPTRTRTATETPTVSVTATASPSPTPSSTVTLTMSATFTRTVSPTRSATPTHTITTLDTPTFTATSTNTRTVTPSSTASPTVTETATATASASRTPTYSGTLTPSFTPTSSSSATASATPTRSSTSTASLTATSSRTVTLSPTQTITTLDTSTNTSTVTPTLTRTSTSTSTPTATMTSSATATPTTSASSTMTSTSTRTRTVTLSPTPTITTLDTSTNTSTVTPTFTQTATYSFSPTSTMSSTSTATPTISSSSTASSTTTRTRTETLSPTQTVTTLDTSTNTSTITPTFSRSPTVTQTPTQTITTLDTKTFTPTGTTTPTCTSSYSATATSTASPTATLSRTETQTSTSTITTLDTATDTSTVTLTSTQTPTRTRSASPTVTSSGTLTASSTPSATVSPSATGTSSVTASSTETPQDSPTSSSTATPSRSVTPTSSASPTATLTATASASSTASASLTASPTVTLSVTASASSTGTPSPSASATTTASPTRSLTSTDSPTPSPSPTASPTPVPLPNYLRLLIYNSAGELVRTLYEGQAQFQAGSLLLSASTLAAPGMLDVFFPGALSDGNGGSRRGDLQWDLRNDASQSVRGGVYTLKAEVRDPFGSISTLTAQVQVLPPPQMASLVIYNSAGEAVRHLMVPSGAFTDLDQPDLQSGRVGFRVKGGGSLQAWLDWDGNTDVGQPLSSGVYMVVFNSASSTGAPIKVTWQVNYIAPPRPDGLGLISLAPNPVRGNTAQVDFSAPPLGSVVVHVFNLAGERVLTAAASAGQGRIMLEVGNLAGGIYLIDLEVLNGPAHLGHRFVRMALAR